MKNPLITAEKEKYDRLQQKPDISSLAISIIFFFAVVLFVVAIAGIQLINQEPTMPELVYYIGFGVSGIFGLTFFNIAKKQAYQYRLCKYMTTKRYRKAYEPYVNIIQTNAILTPITVTMAAFIIILLQLGKHMLPAYIMTWAFTMFCIGAGHLSGAQIFKQETLDPECLPQTQETLEKRNSIVEQLKLVFEYQQIKQPPYEILQNDMRDVLLYTNYMVDFVPYTFWKNLYVKPETSPSFIKSQLWGILSDYKYNPEEWLYFEKYKKQADRFNATNFEIFSFETLFYENSLTNN